MSIEIETKNEKETKKVGEILAKEILKIRPKKEAILICLEGNLGGGKTTFLKGFAKGLKIKERILSPTFIISKKFEIPYSKYKNFFHIDCYRIKSPKEILKLKFNEIIKSPTNIVAIEWADKIKEIIPKEAIWLSFIVESKNKRLIKIKI